MNQNEFSLINFGTVEIELCINLIVSLLDIITKLDYLQV